jgi:hypothetical protein
MANATKEWEFSIRIFLEHSFLTARYVEVAFRLDREALLEGRTDAAAQPHFHFHT